jgi:hypothetical protein
VGTQYTGSTYYAWLVWTSIQVPSSAPVSGDMYAVVFSVFDNDNYYDQIGLASDYGCSACQNPHDTWSVAWEMGTYGKSHGYIGCGWGGSWSRDAFNGGGLIPGQWFTFGMLILSTGGVSYRLWIGENSQTTLVWQLNESSSASYFLIEPSDPNCAGGGSGAADVTLYEEVAYIYGGVYPQEYPRWDFLFNQTSTESGADDVVTIPNSNMEWAEANSPRGTVPYVMDFTFGPDIAREPNEFTAHLFHTDTIIVAPGSWSNLVVGAVFAVGASSPTEYCIVNTCDLGFACSSFPTNNGGVYWTGGTSIPGPVEVSYFAPSGTTPGWYYAGCTATITNLSPTQTTTWIWYIEVT